MKSLNPRFFQLFWLSLLSRSCSLSALLFCFRLVFVFISVSWPIFALVFGLVFIGPRPPFVFVLVFVLVFVFVLVVVLDPRCLACLARLSVSPCSPLPPLRILFLFVLDLCLALVLFVFCLAFVLLVNRFCLGVLLNFESFESFGVRAFWQCFRLFVALCTSVNVRLLYEFPRRKPG